MVNSMPKYSSLTLNTQDILNKGTISCTTTCSETKDITGKENIKEFIDKNKEKLNISIDGGKVDLYLKTKSKIALNSCIIDVNGDISLNYESEPNDMKFDWIQEKESTSHAFIYSSVNWNYSCTQLHQYQEILDVLRPSEFNYYKVNININDIVKIDSYEVKVKKMTIVSEILPTPKISYKIYDVEKNGALEVVIENKLTHKESLPFYIKPDSEEDIATAISKELDKMSTAVELGKTKGEIEISDLSKNVQNYIKTEE